VLFILEEGYFFSDRYELEQRIANGNFGSVWKAFDTNLEQEVALKIFDQVKEPEYAGTNDALKEARILAKLRGERNPYVVLVYDAGTDKISSFDYIVEEYIEGDTVEDYAFESLDNIVRMGLEVSKGLQFLQQQSIFHHDLKGKNIKMRKGGGPVLVDFGLSIDLGYDDEAHGGAWHYRAPEVTRGKPGVKSDLWSLGVVLYHTSALYFERKGYGDVPMFPFQHPDKLSLLIQSLQDDPKKLRVPKRFWKIIAGLLEKDSVERLGILEVQRDLEAYLNKTLFEKFLIHTNLSES